MQDPIVIRQTEVPHGDGGRRIVYRADFMEQAILAPGESGEPVLKEARRRIGLRVYGEIAAGLERLVQQQVEASPDNALEALEVLRILSNLVGSHVSGDFTQSSPGDQAA